MFQGCISTLQSWDCSVMWISLWVMIFLAGEHYLLQSIQQLHLELDCMYAESTEDETDGAASLFLTSLFLPSVVAPISVQVLLLDYGSCHPPYVSVFDNMLALRKSGHLSCGLCAHYTSLHCHATDTHIPEEVLRSSAHSQHHWKVLHHQFLLCSKTPDRYQNTELWAPMTLLWGDLLETM